MTNTPQPHEMSAHVYELLCFSISFPAQCVQGFLDRDLLETLAPQVESYPAEQHVIRNIQFTCNGAITGWMIGAKVRTNGSSLELQTWRCQNCENGIASRTNITNSDTTANITNSDTTTNITNSDTTTNITNSDTTTNITNADITTNVTDSASRTQRDRYMLINTTAITMVQGTIYPNVYEVTQDPPIEFQRGDILGIFQPANSCVELYYHQGVGPYNTREPDQRTTVNLRNDTRDLPLVRALFRSCT